MKARTRITIVLAMIAALLATTASATSAQERPGSPTEDTAAPVEEVLPGEEPLIPLTDAEADELIKVEMDTWLIVRESFGFSGDASMVADLVRTREGQLGMDAWSVPLTFDERAEMDERAVATSNSGEARDVLEDMDGYADMYIDHEEGGIVFVNFNRSLNDAEAQEVRDLFVVPSRVEVRKVGYSLEDLLAVASDIEELRRTDHLPHVTSIAISARENAVMVGVHEEGVTTTTNPRTSDGFLKESKDKTRDKVLNEGRSRKATSADLDEMIEIEVVPVAVSAGCYGRLNCGTSGENWRGGTGLDTNQSGAFADSSCATGFIFTNGAQRLLSTAGHCDRFSNRDVAIAGQNHTGGSFDRFTMNTVITDWPLANATDFNAEVDSDAAMMLINPNRSDNRIYKSYQKKNWYINDRNDDLMEDDVTCVSGAWLGWRCGKVRPLPIPAAVAETSFAEPFDDLSYDVDDYIKFNVVYPGVISTIAGNSGSPMIQGRKAHGLLFGELSLTLLPGNSSTSIEAVFTPTSSIENELGVELCEAAADC